MMVKRAAAARRQQPKPDEQVEAALSLIVPTLREACEAEIRMVLGEGRYDGAREVPLDDVRRKAQQLLAALQRPFDIVNESEPSLYWFGPDHEDWSETYAPELLRAFTPLRSHLLNVVGFTGIPSGGADTTAQRYWARMAFRLMLLFADDPQAAFDLRTKPESRLLRLISALSGQSATSDTRRFEPKVKTTTRRELSRYMRLNKSPFIDGVRKQADGFADLLKMGVPPEDARGVLPVLGMQYPKHVKVVDDLDAETGYANIEAEIIVSAKQARKKSAVSTT